MLAVVRVLSVAVLVAVVRGLVAPKHEVSEHKAGLPNAPHIKVPKPPHHPRKGRTTRGAVRMAPGRHEEGHKPVAQQHEAPAKPKLAAHPPPGRVHHPHVNTAAVKKAQAAKQDRAMDSMKAGLGRVRDRIKERKRAREEEKELEKGLSALKAKK